MAISDILQQAEADLAALAGLPGEIRARVKAGRDELQRLHDAVEAELARMTHAAKATLASLQSGPAADGRAPSQSGASTGDSLPGAGSFGN